MAKVLVLYYSMYGHIETMANAVAEGARSLSGTTVDVKRVPDCWGRAMYRPGSLGIRSRASSASWIAPGPSR